MTLTSEHWELSEPQNLVDNFWIKTLYINDLISLIQVYMLLEFFAIERINTHENKDITTFIN